MYHIYVYVFDTLADWEVGYVTAELHSGRYFKKDAPAVSLTTVGITKEPVRTMGGLRVIQKILQPERTAIGIEKNKPKAIEAIRAAADRDVEVLALRVRYPQGAEKQLIQAVTGRFVPPGGLPAAVGCAVFNVATCAAVYDAVYRGMPLVKRVLTVTGRAVTRPSNFSESSPASISSATWSMVHISREFMM